MWTRGCVDLKHVGTAQMPVVQFAGCPFSLDVYAGCHYTGCWACAEGGFAHHTAAFARPSCSRDAPALQSTSMVCVCICVLCALSLHAAHGHYSRCHLQVLDVALFFVMWLLSCATHWLEYIWGVGMGDGRGLMPGDS